MGKLVAGVVIGVLALWAYQRTPYKIILCDGPPIAPNILALVVKGATCRDL
jgi:hypothetical protein